MPHIILEYSSNLKNLEYKDIFEVAHDALCSHAEADIENCKSQAYENDAYYIADGDTNKAFIHIEISLMEGRSEKIKASIAKEIIVYIESLIEETWREDLYTQISIHFKDIIKKDYFKKTI
ncbi:MAG: hypothetical protein INQ03_19070 [Candidatus Heimdallarchaeota archaeon]|nr:hypothetical protein [Candidatus Heimdallarchaeota archaeon]